jgi:REP element-mobilizing transposase RayT
MPRKPRLFVSGGIYHVYCRTHRGEMRFERQIDRDSFIGNVAEISSLQQLTILAFALMSNHYHLVVRTAVARALATSPCQVSRWLAAQTEALTLDHAETIFIDDTVGKL